MVGLVHSRSIGAPEVQEDRRAVNRRRAFPVEKAHPAAPLLQQIPAANS
ncbi:hypothetical protein LRX75_04215 [Rhizobium sp. DKSPLA3]|uniref:Uncharacterized protein n=1 Tax=Rhizobium quercicola TaxID=2901226 RepID=A0A9X1NQ29_9HYPH|nr:hypothetical protein [Rhizobium quercicola]MCD7108245.1 hypothetical protein [Rhizobium quercicola]